MSQKEISRVSSRNFILGGGGGGKLTDHVSLRPRRGEGRLHIYNILGGKLGQFGGGGGSWGSFPCAPPPLDETLIRWLLAPILAHDNHSTEYHFSNKL